MRSFWHQAAALLPILCICSKYGFLLLFVLRCYNTVNY